MLTQANYCSEFRLPFTVYKQILQKILDIAQRKISIKSPEEDIYNDIFKWSKYTLQYSDTSHVIKNISFWLIDIMYWLTTNSN